MNTKLKEYMIIGLFRLYVPSVFLIVIDIVCFVT